MTLEEAYEYVEHAREAESEQRAEYGMGAVSMGYDPHEWAPAYDGYRCSDDETFAEAQRIIGEHLDEEGRRLHNENVHRVAANPVDPDDIPF